MIAVLPFTVPETVYDHKGNILEKEGDTFVSHGIDLDTGESVILPSDNFKLFTARFCYYNQDVCEYILKEELK